MSNMNPNLPTREFSMHKEMSQILISGQRPVYYFDFPRKLPFVLFNFSYMVIGLHTWLFDLHCLI